MKFVGMLKQPDPQSLAGNPWADILAINKGTKVKLGKRTSGFHCGIPNYEVQRSCGYGVESFSIDLDINEISDHFDYVCMEAAENDAAKFINRRNTFMRDVKHRAQHSASRINPR